jgi:hypothetical protein
MTGSSSTRRILAAFSLMLAGSVFAEFSPLSIHPEGFGMPVAPMGARERALGEAGMASITAGGFFPGNPARSAFHEKTVFTATLEGDVDWLRDDVSSTRASTGGFPNLATLVKTKTFGTFGAYYQQTFLRNFEVRMARSGDTAATSYVAEGGVYTLGASWGYAVRPWLALGVAQNLVLSRDRYIRPADFSDVAPPEAENLADTTLETNAVGAYPTLSMMLRLPRNLDLALAYSHSARLDVSRSRSTNHLGSDPVADTTAELPKTLSIGASWRPDRRQTAVFDLVYEDWTDSRLLNPAWSVGAGYEFRASMSPFDGLIKRTAWRAGAGYKMLYLREVPEVYATAGFGMPLGPRGHQLDFAMKYGHRRFDGNTFFTEDYVKLSASVVGVSVWGQPARRRR